MKKERTQKKNYRGFSGSPVVETWPSNAGGMGFIPGWGTKILHAIRQGTPLKELY